MGLRVWAAVLVCLLAGGVCRAQGGEAVQSFYDRKNGWTVFTEYSNTSSHILMGLARQRKLVTLGGAYTRRLVRFHGTELGYQAEVRPVVFESDPLEVITETISFPSDPSFGGSTVTNAVPVLGVCSAFSETLTEPPDPPYPTEQLNVSATCGRRWTFGQAFSPLGFRYAMGTSHRVQPFVTGTLGYMYASRPIPVSNAEAFNFAFDFGAGVEVFRTHTRSVSMEVRYHHFSNRDTAQANPGTDNVMYKLSYSFGH